MNCNFLTAGNLVNLLVQAAVFSLLAMAEVFVLLLGDIDLSVGFVAAIGGASWRRLSAHISGRGGPASRRRCSPAPPSALVQGSIITRLGLPSFVVTLAGFLFWQGVLLRILGNGGSVAHQQLHDQRHRQPPASPLPRAGS